MKRCCTKCGFPLVGKKAHGFVVARGGVVCGQCPKPWPKVETGD